jgi:hypothetical protein
MRLPFLLLLLYLAISAPAHACSCNGTQSIAGALSYSHDVVIGRVKGLAALESPNYIKATVVEVIDRLTGGISGEIKVLDTICYQSFYATNLTLGADYVFPLLKVDRSDPLYFPGSDSDAEQPNSDLPLYGLQACSHTALLLTGSELYTNELAQGGGRKLKSYMSLPLFRFLFSSGLIEYWARILAGALVAGAFLVLIVVRKRRGATNGPV